MQAFRVDPIEQQPFIVIAEEGQDFSDLVRNPLCFSPANFRIKEVSVGQLNREGDHLKILLAGENANLKEITKSHALDIVASNSQDDGDYLEGCVAGLVEAMQELGMAAPVSIQLEDQGEALKMLSVFAEKLKAESFHTIKEMIERGRLDHITVSGVDFCWEFDGPIPITSALRKLLFAA